MTSVSNKNKNQPQQNLQRAKMFAEQQQHQVTAAMFASKYRSKREV